jgi:hypothetical protein
MGTHNRSENGRGAWVALCVHLTHTDTDIDKEWIEYCFFQTY